MLLKKTTSNIQDGLTNLWLIYHTTMMDRKQDVKCVKQTVLITVPLYFVGSVGILYLGRSHVTEN